MAASATSGGGITDRPKASNSDKLKALEFLAKYGIGSAATDPVLNVGQLHLDAFKVLAAVRSVSQSASEVEENRA